MVCRPRAEVVEFPDGTRGLAPGWWERGQSDSVPPFGVYLDRMWQADWPAAHLEWPDFGVPSDVAQADAVIEEALSRARQGEQVEVACVGGHGRTGTVLACMAVLAGVSPEEAVSWVRA